MDVKGLLVSYHVVADKDYGFALFLLPPNDYHEISRPITISLKSDELKTIQQNGAGYYDIKKLVFREKYWRHYAPIAYCAEQSDSSIGVTV